MFRLSVFQAGSVALTRRRAIEAPACYEPQIQLISNDTFPSWREDEYEVFKSHSSYLWYLFSRIGLIPFAIIMLQGYLRSTLVFWLVLGLSWLVVAFLYSWAYQRSLRLFISDNHAYIEKGVIERERVVLDMAKLQGVEMRQNPIEYRRALSSLRLFTAAGSQDFPYLERSSAERIYNYILYLVESSKKPWM